MSALSTVNKPSKISTQIQKSAVNRQAVLALNVGAVDDRLNPFIQNEEVKPRNADLTTPESLGGSRVNEFRRMFSLLF